MPAIAALVLRDAATPPVNHTFSPVTTNGSASQHADRASVTPAGQRKLSVEVKQVSQPGKPAYHQVSAGLYTPTEQLVDGVTQVVYAQTGKITFTFSAAGTERDRLDQVSYFADLLANATFKQVVQFLEPYY